MRPRALIPSLANAGQIQHPHLSQSLSRFLQVKGPTVAPSLATEIVPVIVVADIREEVEKPTATGPKWCMASKNQVANPANYSIFTFHNITNPGLDIRIYDLWLWSSDDCEFRIAPDFTMTAGASDPMDQELRYGHPLGISGGWFPSARLAAGVEGAPCSAEYLMFHLKGGVLTHLDFQGRLRNGRAAPGDFTDHGFRMGPDFVGDNVKKVTVNMTWTEENLPA